MSVVRYPITDRVVKLKMLDACRDNKERSLVLLLLNTGLLPSMFCNLRKWNGRAREWLNVLRDGNTRYISWKRPKTNKTLRSFPLKKDELAQIETFLASPAKSNKHFDEILRSIGQKAGYDGVSCLTMRHTYCIWLLRSKSEGGAGMTIYQVPHWMGCTIEVVVRNYSIMSGSQIMEEVEGSEMTPRISFGDRY